MRSYIALTIMAILFSHLTYSQNNKEIDLTHFDKLRVTNQINVYLTKGDIERAKIISKGISIDDVILDVEGKTLEISLKRGVYKDISVEVYLTYQELRDVFVTGSGKASFQDALTGDKVVLNASNGQIDANVNLRTLDVSTSKAGSIRLNGKLGSYEAEVSTGAVLSALELKADSVFVKVTTKGIAKVFAKELLDANVKSGASLTISGDPNKKLIKKGLAVTIQEQ